MTILALLTIGLFVTFGMYIGYIAAKKARQQRNNIEPNQIDGTIADEGVSFCDIAGSPIIHGNIVWKGDESTLPIKEKQGGKK